jgi:hypothetical protein
VKKDDILILASDGLSDNLWDEEVLDEVVRFRRGFLVDSQEVDGLKTEEVALNTTTEVDKALEPGTTTGGGVKRKTLAGMLSEALCSRARRVSERKSGSIPIPVPILRRSRETGGTCHAQSVRLSSSTPIKEHDDDEIPFARRAREAGRRFTGGKKDGEFLFESLFFFSSSFLSFFTLTFEPLSSPILRLPRSSLPLCLFFLSFELVFSLCVFESFPLGFFFRRVSIQTLTCSVGYRYLGDRSCHLTFEVADFFI